MYIVISNHLHGVSCKVFLCLLLRKSLCLFFGNKERPFVFMTSKFCFITIINIALDVYESYHPLVKNISLTEERSPLTRVVIRYCGEQKWSCVGWRAALTPAWDIWPAQVSRARKLKSRGHMCLPMCCIHCAELINGKSSPTLSAHSEYNTSNVQP